MSVAADVVAEVEDLRVEVGGRAVVDGVSLRVRAGTVTALVGASGSGKTTTGLALLGAYPPGARVSGTVTVTDRLVGHVPQHPAAVLNPARRAGALLTDIARTQVRHLPRRERARAATARINEALSRAQLTDPSELLRRYPHQLSGGQQQRVVLAQALLLGARVVVADEPTTGQDALTKRRIVAELVSVVRQGIGVLLLSHDLDVVRELADEVVVLKGGRVVEAGPVEQVVTSARHAWTRQLFGAEEGSGAVPGVRGDTGPDAPPEGKIDADSSPGAALEVRSETDAVLEVRNLAAHHRGGGARRTVDVLCDVSLRVRPGERVAVVGRSGSGKTTLGRCLAGLHRTYDGEVHLDGVPLPRSLRNRTPRQLAAVQYVFQDAHSSFDEHRTLLAQVARTAVRLRGAMPADAAREAEALLAEVGLREQHFHSRPGRLSGGELQRAALARALLARPRVLVCDEITSGLDTVTRRTVLAVLDRLLRDQPDLALVWITHDLKTAARTDRILVLDTGDVVEEGPATRVLTAPGHPFTAALVEASGEGGGAIRGARTATRAQDF
ncbi:ABC transporter ATP-binding protein [Streptomyces chrestomyceticus JCM 4735]|uniref:ABC transporter ATP-binding protein n=1 Tax=Streptomyces chrestomyceticus JCM 4735 TaxID=1306181 RepID=A0A7U9KSY8_9ACTN|nr:ATP-binding cassette domain-containing protein [Streptomyces chrestomyceticus]GCD34198.1 ABC transporter ATP-binding protein [Streptomyces chrestomyceticus JCM 4735]